MKTILLCSDLFFIAKVKETALHLGTEVSIAKDKETLIKESIDAKLIIADLNFDRFNILEALAQIKRPEMKIIGYLSHVQVDLKKKSEKVCTLVMSRSEFSARLPELLSY